MTNTRAGDGAWIYLAATTLVLFAPFSSFLIANQYPLASAEVLIVLAACAAAGAVVSLAVPLEARPAAALLLGAVTALAIDLMYDLRVSRWVLLLAPLLCLALAWVLRRNIALILLVASFVLLATTLPIPPATAVPLAPLAGEAQSQPRTDRNGLPVVLHLILDEHIGIDGLPKDLAESADFGRWLTDYYLQRGFRLYRGAYSEYMNTHDSIPNC